MTIGTDCVACWLPSPIDGVIMFQDGTSEAATDTSCFRADVNVIDLNHA